MSSAIFSCTTKMTFMSIAPTAGWSFVAEIKIPAKGRTTTRKRQTSLQRNFSCPHPLLNGRSHPLWMQTLLDEEVLKPLARKYQVSTQAFTFRLMYLGYVQP